MLYNDPSNVVHVYDDHFRIEEKEKKYLLLDSQSIHPYKLHSFFQYNPEHNYHMLIVHLSHLESRLG